MLFSAFVILSSSVVIHWSASVPAALPYDYDYSLQQMLYTRIGGIPPATKDAVLRMNMRSVELAAEDYALDNDDCYPEQVDALFKTYFYQGDRGGIKAGQAPLNVMSGKQEWPTTGSFSTVSSAKLADDTVLTPGQIEYNPIRDRRTGRVVNYAIRGCGHDGRPVRGKDSGIVVLTNANKPDGEPDTQW